MIRVLSWQRSGVAWVPWRMAQACAMAPCRAVEVELWAPNPQNLECYGLPCPVRGAVSLPSVAAQLSGPSPSPDWILLHHSYVAQRSGDLEAARSVFPAARVAVMIHGEPDREQLEGGHSHRSPREADLYIAVSSDLVPLLQRHRERVPVALLPNHPVREIEPGRPYPDRPRSMYVPFSHVAAKKDHPALRRIEPEIQRDGWEVVWETRRRSNDEVLAALGEHRMVWVQLQGYAPDILTQEAWARCCIPIVTADSQASVRWRYPFGFASAASEDLIHDIRERDREGVDMVTLGLAAAAERSATQYAEEIAVVFSAA